jgi:hypothetical protein
VLGGLLMQNSNLRVTCVRLVLFCGYTTESRGLTPSYARLRGKDILEEMRFDMYYFAA